MRGDAIDGNTIDAASVVGDLFTRINFAEVTEIVFAQQAGRGIAHQVDIESGCTAVYRSR